MTGLRLTFVLVFSSLVVGSSEHGIKKFFGDVFDENSPIPEVDVPVPNIGKSKPIVGDSGKALLRPRVIAKNQPNAAEVTTTKMDVPNLDNVGNESNVEDLGSFIVPSLGNTGKNEPDLPNVAEIEKLLPPMDAEIQTVPDLKDLKRIDTTPKTEKILVKTTDKKQEVAGSSAITCQVQVIVCCFLLLNVLMICPLW